MIEQGLYTLLTTDAAVSALVGVRIFPNKLPQPSSTWPQITYHRVSKASTRHMTGVAGVPSARLQIDCWGLDYSNAKTTANAVRKAVEGTAASPRAYPSRWGASWVVRRAWVEDERDDYFPGTHGDDVGNHRCIVEVVVFFEDQ